MTGPLSGRRILVTGGRSGRLGERLKHLGATVFEVPAITSAPLEDTTPLDQALSSLDSYDWLVFTSANAVSAVRERLRVLGREVRVPVASVGPATSEKCRELLGRVDLQPERDYRAEGLLEALARVGVAGKRCLLPVSDRARPTLASGLRELGATAEVRVAYRTVQPADFAPRLAEALEQGIDLVTFAAPSAVEGFVATSGDRGRRIPAVALGPVTAAAVREAGLDLCRTADPATVDGLVEAIRAYFG